MDKRILIVEDEISINDILRRALMKEGYNIKSAYSGQEALEALNSFKPHLVLLDIMLPDTTGFNLAEVINKKAYIIMITARNSIEDKLHGIDIGADDYITKPFDIREVKMRVKMVLRREEKLEVEENIELDKLSDKIEGKVFVMDSEKRTLLKGEKYIKLNRKEFDLLYFLYKNKNHVFSREDLLTKVWGYDYFGDDRTVDVHIRRIRGKLGEDRENSTIETVFGVGYVMR